MADFQSVTKTVKIVVDASAAKAGGQEAQTSFEALQHSIDSTEKHLESLKSGFESAADKIKEFAVMVGIGFSVEKIYEFTEAWEKANYQLEAVMGSSGAARAGMEAMFEASQRSRTGIEGNVETFSRLLIVQDQLGASQKQIAEFTESVSTAMSLMGKGSGETAGMVGNFTRSLASGTVGTREFRTILAETPQLAVAMADHIDGAGGSVQRLRDMMKAGQVSSKDFFNAIRDALPEMQERLAELPPTVGQAGTEFKNAFEKMMGGADDATGATHRLADAIILIANNLPDVTKVVIAGAAGWVGYALATGGATGALALLRAGLVATWAFMAANPIGLVVAALTAAAVAAYEFRDHLLPLRATASAVFDTIVESVKNAVEYIKLFATAAYQASHGDMAGLAETKKQYDALGASIATQTTYSQKYNAALSEMQIDLLFTKDKAGELSDAVSKGANSTVDATQKQIDAFHKLRDELDPMAKATDEYTKRMKELTDAHKQGLVAGKDFLDLQQKIHDQAILDVRQAQEKIDIVGTEISKIQEHTKETLLETQGRKDLADAAKIEYDMRLKMVAISPAEVKAIQDATAADELATAGLKAHKDALAEVQKAADKTFKAEVQFAQQASTQIVDAMVNVFEGSKGPLDNLLNYVKKTAEQIIAAMTFQPIILDFVASVAGSLGGGAAGGAGGATSAIGAAASVGGAAGLFTGVGSSVSNAVNAWGAANLGTGTGVASGAGWATGEGGATAGSIGGGATLTSILGGAAVGAVVGNLLTSLVGGNKTVNTIGGAATGASAIALGFTNPITLGILGVTAILSALLAGKPSDKAEGAIYNPATGALTNPGNTKHFSQDNLDSANSIIDQVKSLINGLEGASGGKLSVAGSANLGNSDWGQQNSIGVKVGGRDGIDLAFGSDSAHFAVNDTKGATDWIVQEVVTHMKGMPADVETAIKKIDWTGDLQSNLSLIAFAKGFQDTLKALTSGTTDITKNAETAASAQIANTTAIIKKFMDTTAQLGLDTGAAAAATKAYVEQLVGIRTSAANIGAAETAFKTLDGTLSALKPLLDLTGIAFADAAAAIAKTKDAIKAANADSIQGQIDQLKHPFVATISKFFSDFAAESVDANFLGNGDKLKELLGAQLENAMSGMDANTLRDVVSYYSTISGGQPAVDAATAALAKLGTTAQAAAQVMGAAQVTAANDNLKAVDAFLQSQQALISGFVQQATAWQGVSTGLAAAASGLLTNSALSPLSPGDQFSVAQDRYNSISSAAARGDQTAAGQLGQASTDYLTAAKAYFGGGADYYARFQQVQATLLNTKAVADVQASIAQRQADLLQRDVDAATRSATALDGLLNGSKIEISTMQGVWSTLQSIQGTMAAAGVAVTVPNIAAPQLDSAAQASPSQAQYISELRASNATLHAQNVAQQATLDQMARDLAAMRASLGRAAA